MSKPHSPVEVLGKYINFLKDVNCGDDKYLLEDLSDAELLIDRLKHDKDKRISPEEGFIMNKAISYCYDTQVGWEKMFYENYYKCHAS